jgi:hypothetical protein
MVCRKTIELLIAGAAQATLYFGFCLKALSPSWLCFLQILRLHLLTDAQERFNV